MEIYNLFEIPEDKLNKVGGKAERLCMLNKAGFNVPGGFVIFDGKTENDIESAAGFYEKSGLKTVAVRSSATSEDAAGASSAGQYETVLNVSGREEFIKAVKTCLESLKSDTAEAYNKVMNVSARENQMTVVVQEMVDVSCAGVAFSSDPLNPGVVLVEAVEGLGEGLVSGAKSSDEYRISGEKSINRKGNILTDTQIYEIYDGVKKIAESFGFEADVEWAIDKKGTLNWLQVRPITTEDAPAIDEFDPKTDLTDCVVTNCNISEMMPGAITPLTLTTSAYGIDWGLRKLLIHSGVYKDEKELPPYSCYMTINGHLFLNLTAIYAISKKMVMASKESIDLSICGRVLDSGIPDIKEPATLLKVFNFSKYITAVMSRKKACKDAEKIASTLKIAAKSTPLEMWKEIDSHMPEMQDVMYDHYMSSAFSGMISSALNLQLAPYFDKEEDRHAAVSSCMFNIPDIESADLLRKLYGIADAVKKEFPSENYTADSMKNAVENGNAEIKKLYAEFMAKHGHRSIDECEMRQKSLCDDPDTFYKQLARVANSGVMKENTENWEENQEKLLNSVPADKRSTFKVMIKFSREGVYVREYTKSRIVKVSYIFKKAYEILAEEMVAEGMLPDTDCVYFLTHEELGKVVKGEGEALPRRAVARRRLFAEQKNMKFKDVIFGRPEPIQFNEEEYKDKVLLSGTPVSRGVAEGPAHIVKSVEDADKLKAGDIMIAQFTDTGWTPYYSTIAGLVTEIGAALSHGAVVAREYSLPLITNVPHATDIVKEGQMVRIDGEKGTVTIL